MNLLLIYKTTLTERREKSRLALFCIAEDSVTPLSFCDQCNNVVDGEQVKILSIRFSRLDSRGESTPTE